MKNKLLVMDIEYRRLWVEEGRLWKELDELNLDKWEITSSFVEISERLDDNYLERQEIERFYRQEISSVYRFNKNKRIL